MEKLLEKTCRIGSWKKEVTSWHWLKQNVGSTQVVRMLMILIVQVKHVGYLWKKNANLIWNHQIDTSYLLLLLHDSKAFSLCKVRKGKHGDLWL